MHEWKLQFFRSGDRYGANGFNPENSPTSKDLSTILELKKVISGYGEGRPESSPEDRRKKI